MANLEHFKYKLQERIEEYQKEMYIANSDESSNILYYEGAIDSLKWALEKIVDSKLNEDNEAWGDY